MKKFCLIIDDNDQMSNIKNLKAKAKTDDGLDIECEYFDITNKILLDKNFDLKIDQVEKHLKDLYFNKSIDIIACDYNIGYANANGLDIIKLIRNNNIKCPIILYSGDINKVLNDILNSSTDTVSGIKNLMNYDIHEFVKRNEYENKVRYIIKNSFSIEQELIKKLNEYPNREFLPILNSFKKNKLSKIIENINNNLNKAETQKFISEFFEYSIANLIDMDS